MRYSYWLTLISAAVLPLLGRAAEPFAMPNPLPAHPRVIVAKADWERLRALEKSDDADFQMLYKTLEFRAKSILSQPPAERVMEGRRLLGTSRKALERVTILAAMANLSDDPAYAERAIAEMRAVCHFTDWNPSHFLDVGEMSLAIAIGYDWLYDKLSSEDRSEIERALVEKGIQPSYPGPGEKPQFWVSGNNNWTQVCHAGLSAAAIAVADSKPELAAQVLQRAIDNVPKAGLTYAPDGVYLEGPGYWEYGTSFHVLMAAELQRFCGSAHGLDTLEGFEKTPVYLTEVISPGDRCFNYSDCGDKRDFSVPMFWFARRFEQPALQRSELDFMARSLQGKKNPGGFGGRLFPFAVLWYDAAHAKGKASLPLQWLGKGVNPVAVHRSAFDDANATFIALKGGSPSCNHAHMDGGVFVMEADGVRWALDLGAENYNKLETSGVGLWDGKQDGQRWDIFRLGSEGHSILRFNGAKQAIKGNAQFVRFNADGAQGCSVVELTSLYPGMKSVRRGIALLPSRAVLFQDEWTPAGKAVDAGWQWITKADVTVQPGEIKLTQNGKQLTLRILAPANAEVEVKPAQDFQQWYDTDNPGVKRIVIKAHAEPGKEGSFRVLAVPGSCAAAEAPALQPLENWPGK